MSQKIEFIASPNFSKGRKRKPLVIVLHTTESPEVPNGASRVARNWFANKASKVSAHYIVSSEELVQCVREEDTAWHAGKANGWSIGVEMCGKAGQSSSDWLDEFSRKMLGNAAKLVASLCRRHDIPVARLQSAEIKLVADGALDMKGICGHADLKVLGGNHWDPGPHFPWQEFMYWVLMLVADPTFEPLEQAPAKGK